MYSNQMSLGDNPSGQTGARRDAYRVKKRAAKPRKVRDVLNINMRYEYISTRSGAYDEIEREFMGDHYADGWAWRESGKPLSAFKVSRFRSKAYQAEAIRLFIKGFNDYREQIK